MTKYPDYIRQKAIQLRTEKNMTVGQIADQLKIAKSTAYEWTKGIPIPRTQAQTEAQRQKGEIIRKKHEKLRHLAYTQGLEEAPELLKNPMFRDFVSLYLAEGSKKQRHYVDIGNSDPVIIQLAHYWFEKYKSPEKRILYAVQIHEDQIENDIRTYWASVVNVSPEKIKISRKSNSGQLGHRNFRSEYGVLSIRVCETLLLCRVKGWIDALKQEWGSFVKQENEYRSDDKIS